MRPSGSVQDMGHEEEPRRGGEHDDTVIRPRRPLEPEGAPGPSDGADEATVIRLIEPDVPPTVPLGVPAGQPLSAAVLPSRPPDDPIEPAMPARAGAATLRIPGVDREVALHRPVVIGRRPSAVRMPETPSPLRIVVPADRRGVSARHARIEQLGSAIVVTDLGSSNGIVVHFPDGSVRRLRPGESCAVLPDSVVSLGDGIDIVVQAAAPEAS